MNYDTKQIPNLFYLEWKGYAKNRPLESNVVIQPIRSQFDMLESGEAVLLFELGVITMSHSKLF